MKRMVSVKKLLVLTLIFAMVLTMMPPMVVSVAAATPIPIPIAIDVGSTLTNFTGTLGDDTANTMFVATTKYNDYKRISDQKTITNNAIVDGTGKLQLTNNSNWQVGTIVRRSPIKLNNGFSTYFKFDINTCTTTKADGLAFILYDASGGLKMGAPGGCLGLNDLNTGNDRYTNDGTSNGTGFPTFDNSIAVEFDTFQNDKVPQEDHYSQAVAIDVSGSTAHTSGLPYATTSAAVYDDTSAIDHEFPSIYDSTGTNPMNVWVDYQDNSGVPIVTVTYGLSATRNDPGNRTIIRHVGSTLLNKDVYVGFNASTGGAGEYHQILAWDFNNTYISGGLIPGSYTQAASGITIKTGPTHAGIQLKDAVGVNLTSAQDINVSIDGGSPSSIKTDANGHYDYPISGLTAGPHTITAVTADGSAQNSAAFTVTSLPIYIPGDFTNLLANSAGDTMLQSSGAAAVASSKFLQLTDNTQTKVGTIVRRNQMVLNGGLSAYFQADMYNFLNSSADGLCFVVYDGSQGVQSGESGISLGYSDYDHETAAIKGPSFAVELDTYDNTKYEFANGSSGARHVAIDTNDWDGSRPNNTPQFTISPTVANVIHGSYTTSTSTNSTVPTDDGTAAIAHSYSGLYDSTLNGGNPTNVWVDYVPVNASNHSQGGIVTVTYGPDTTRTSTQNYTFKRQIAANLFDSKGVYVGFSASTGGDAEYHVINKWYFSNSPIAGGINPNAEYVQAASSIVITPNNSSTNPTTAVIQLKGATGAALTYAQGINISIDNGAAASATSDTSGAYTFTIPGGLTSGSHTITAVTTDGSAQNSAAFTVASAATVTITAPVPGVTPQTAAQVETVTNNADYTVTGLTWNQALTAGNKFKAGQVYTATVTLTSKNGKEFQAAAFIPTVAGSDSVGTTTTTGTGTGNTVSFTVTYAATGALQVTGIAVTTQPTMMSYTEGETLDLSGLVATLTYNDGTTADVALAQFAANSITPSPANGTVMSVATHNGNPVTLTCNTHTATTSNLTVNAAVPSAPTIQSAAAGDSHVSITWSSVSGATGYKIYKSTTSGSYGSALATVGGSVYSYDATGLTNGTTYYFVVKASNAGGDSVNSIEASATPQVGSPGAPVLQSAVAGDGHVNITWNAVVGSTGYKVYASTTSGSYNAPATTVTGSVYSSDVTGLTNGTTYHYVVKATNPGGDSAYSNEVSAMPQVSVPSVPTGVIATGGNSKVTLNWNSVTGVTGYKIYQSTTSGSYGAALATVTGSIYNYEATGLTNGVTYYFVIKATNAGGDSPSSAEVSAIPKTVPGVPTNVTATVGNGEATISFTAPTDNGGSTITGYVVTPNPGNITATGTGTSITVTGLSNGTTYTFTVKAVNVLGNGQDSVASSAITPYRHSSGGSSGGSSTPSTPTTPTEPAKPGETGVEILVNGKTETAATATTTKVDDKTVTTVTVDDKKVEEKLLNEGNNAVVTIPIKNDADVVIGQLNGQTVKNMETKEVVLEIKTGNVTYTLPASQINIDNVSSQIGKQVELKDILVNVKISAPSQETAKIVQDTANKNSYQVVVKPVEFEITCTSGNKTVEVSKFNGYVERMVAIPDGVDPSKITTGIVLNNDGTFSHVPTTITVIDGKYYAKINSLTNSTYSVIWSPKTFKDVENHWAKDAVNDMGSRLVIDGVGDGKFEPDRDITRAEFAVIVVKALGLMRTGTGKDAFKDVTKDDWYYDAVSIAYEYGIAGYGSGKFGPMDKITREQAMTMIARAMKITGLKVEFATGEEDKLLKSFGDAGKSADYAKNSIAACIKTGIVSGRNDNFLAPKENITRAEVAVIVRRLLQKSNLI